MDDDGVPGGTPRQDQLIEEASIWFARMRGPEADEYRPEFDRWLARGAAQRSAYNLAGEVFAHGKFLAGSEDEQIIKKRNAADPLFSPKSLALAAWAMLALGLGAWFSHDLLWPAPTDRLEIVGHPETAPDFERVSADNAQRREVSLGDGSRVILEPGAVLGTRFSASRRELRLERGRARFEVAHEDRPFIVYAGGGSVTARGTVFDVILDARNEVIVHLVRGAVDVSRPNRLMPERGNSQIVARLSPGETLRFAASALPEATQPLSAGSFARTGDIVDFDKTPVSAVIAQANQGSAIEIRVADPSIGALQVSGRFRIDDAELVAERLATLLNLRADRIGSEEILLEKR